LTKNYSIPFSLTNLIPPHPRPFPNPVTEQIGHGNSDGSSASTQEENLKEKSEKKCKKEVLDNFNEEKSKGEASSANFASLEAKKEQNQTTSNNPEQLASNPEQLTSNPEQLTGKGISEKEEDQNEEKLMSALAHPVRISVQDYMSLMSNKLQKKRKSKEELAEEKSIKQAKSTGFRFETFEK
jgi:hypothetical protein